MKKIEKKVRDEISGIILSHTNQGRNGWKGHIGEIWVEIRDEIIYCTFYSTIFICLEVSEGEVTKFIVQPVGKGLTQIKWLLKQLKR